MAGKNYSVRCRDLKNLFATLVIDVMMRGDAKTLPMPFCIWDTKQLIQAGLN